MKPIPASRFSRRVDVQQAVDVTDAYNDRVRTWETIATTWAWVTPLTGREVLQSGQLETKLTHRVVIRWTSSYQLTSTKRLVYDGRVFEIERVINMEEKNAYWEVMAIEVEGVTV